MADVTIRVDTRQFVAAMEEYQRATHKDMQVVINKQCGNWALRAAQFVRVAQKAVIKDLWRVAWWNKFMSAAINRGVLVGSRKRYKKGERPADGRRTYGYTTFYESRRNMKRAELIKLSKRILARRAGRAHYFRVLFLGVAELFRGNVSLHGAATGLLGEAVFGTVVANAKGRFSGMRARRLTQWIGIAPPTAGQLRGAFAIRYVSSEHETRGDKGPADAEAKARIGEGALLRARSYVIADMLNYARSLVRARAASISARRAA